jgi:hypothetical protein
MWRRRARAASVVTSRRSVAALNTRAAAPLRAPYAVRFCQHCGDAIPRRPNEAAATLTPADRGREAELYRGLRYENVRLRGA